MTLPHATGSTQPTPSPAALRPHVVIARGDGIGPEIMEATLRVLDAAGARLELEEIEIGEKVYLSGETSGIRPEAWDALRKSQVFLKAPITTPRGSGYKSLNVTARKTLGLFANVRPCVSYHPFVKTHHPAMDVVVVRENEEDTYAGIEHRQTREVTQCLKLITRPGSERCIRFAFEYAVRNGRKRITCLTKDNIMKLTDGLFRQVFQEVAREYPQIETEELIVDIGTAWLAERPENFDVVVTPNLYGDIISDITAQLTGSVGLCGSANIGLQCAMFEAIHGSAPDIAGKGVANPSGLMLAAVSMLVHLGQGEVAERMHNAWLKTIEDGIHTGDIFRAEVSTRQVGTREFADAVIARLGQEPETLPVAHYLTAEPLTPPANRVLEHREEKTLTGVDVFVDWEDSERDPDVLAARLRELCPEELELIVITNRGVKVWPEGLPETFKTDHWRCRFLAAEEGGAISHRSVVALLSRLAEGGVDFIKTEHLYDFDGEKGYSLAQGQ
jgi:isocitrate dehydrogenase